MSIRALYVEEEHNEQEQWLYQTEEGFKLGYLIVYDDQGSQQSADFCVEHRNALKELTQIDRGDFPLAVTGGAVVRRKLRNRLRVARGSKPAAISFPRPPANAAATIKAYVEGLGVEWVRP